MASRVNLTAHCGLYSSNSHFYLWHRSGRKSHAQEVGFWSGWFHISFISSKVW